MKISVQEKIAELERRTAAIEERERISMRRYSQEFVSHSNGLGQHWDKMWEEFRLVMKEAFGR